MLGHNIRHFPCIFLKLSPIVTILEMKDVRLEWFRNLPDPGWSCQGLQTPLPYTRPCVLLNCRPVGEAFLLFSQTLKIKRTELMPRIKLSKANSLRDGFGSGRGVCSVNRAWSSELEHPYTWAQIHGGTGWVQDKKLGPGANSPTLPYSGMFFWGIQEPKFDSEHPHCYEGMFVKGNHYLQLDL